MALSETPLDVDHWTPILAIFERQNGYDTLETGLADTVRGLFRCELSGS